MFSLCRVRADELKFDRLSINDGLSENVVYCILQDKKGFMWFGTHDGLNRYDGYSFKVFRNDPFDSTSLCNNNVTALYEDKVGRFWIGTYNGLSLFDEKTETFRSFYHDSTTPTSLAHNQVNTICEDKNGRLLFGTVGGVEEMVSEGKFRHYNSANIWCDIIHSLFVDSAGTVWVGTNYALDTIDFKNSTLNTLLAIPSQALSIERDGLGRILIGTFNKLLLYEMNDNTLRYFTPDPQEHASHGNNTVKSIFRDSKGKVWLGTYHGLMKFDPGTNTAQHYFHSSSDPQSLSSNKIYSLYEDRSGVLWVGTFGGGVSKTSLHQKKFLHHRIEPEQQQQSGLNMVMSIYEDKTGLLWFGTWDKGVICYNRSAQTSTIFPSPYAMYRQFREDTSGNMYWGEYQDIVQFNRRHRTLVKRQYLYGSILSVWLDRLSSIWVGTSNGLVRLNGSLEIEAEYHHIPGDPTSIGGVSVSSIVEDANDILWFSAGGLNRFEKKTGRVKVFKPDPENRVRLCMDDNVPLHISHDGKIWIGSRGSGLFCFDPASESFTRITMKEGLPNNYIYGILEEENGALWLSTNKGLSRFDPASGMFRNYDVSDGLQSNEFNTGAFFKSTRGEFFFGGINGVNSFFPKEIENNTHVPNIVVTGFQVFNKPFMLPTDITETKEILLPYDKNFFSFEFTALDFVNPKKNHYRYRLEGFDKEWIDAGTSRTASYTGVHPGEYTFHVLGSNNDGKWNEQGARIAIIITPPFWATWWFRTLVGIILFTTIVWTSRTISVRRMKAKMKELEHQHALEKERFRISKDMHDEIGSQLTQIGLMSGLAKRDKADPEKIERTLEDISQTTQEIVSSFDEIVWAVNPRYDTLEGLLDYLAQYASSFLDRAGIEVRTELPTVQEQIHVSAENRHNIFMIVKESLTNVIKYAEATEVLFLPKIENGIFSLLIQDNGRGFDAASVKQFSEGLNNMKLRMEEIGGEFNLTSVPGKGTSITITVKLS